MIGKVQFVLRETGNLFAISLEGVRRIPDVRSWWKEYLRQCWFIAKVTSVPVVLISIPFGAVIALHVGRLLPPARGRVDHRRGDGPGHRPRGVARWPPPC